MQLYDYQQSAKARLNEAWKTVRNVLLVLATRGGKTVIFADVLKDCPHPCVAIAHRQELLGQISLALARFGVKHRVIAPKKVIRMLVQQHITEVGTSFYDPGANCAVAGVDTLTSKKRQDELKHWFPQVRLWVQDEAHHIQKGNKWGRAADLFPNAKGLGVTANTIRADGGGLGRHADGIMDVLIESIGLRELIDRGFATPYRIFSPPAKDLNLDDITISSKTGDYNPTQLKASTRKSSVMGDVVEHYIKLAYGKLGVTFAPDTETATDIAQKFNLAGIPAEVISHKTPDKQRIEIQKRFKNKEVWMLVNVDLFGEGYDVPGIEVVIMARATASFNLFCQQFARGLTLMDGKLVAIIIDHVGNCMRFSRTHGMPDSKIAWSLDRQEKSSRQKTDPDLIPTRVCPDCTSLYEAIYKLCPFCGHKVIPQARSAPEFVDGDLEELDLATLATMRGDVDKIDKPADAIRGMFERAGKGAIVAGGAANQHRRRQEAQTVLRGAIALWAGYQRSLNRPDSESYRRFYFKFGVDVLTAQTLGRPDAEALTLKVQEDISHVTKSNQ